MGIYIEGLESPKTGTIRIQLYDDGTVWAFQGFGWEHQEKKYTDLDIVRCGECKYQYMCGHQINRHGLTLKLTCCEYGERRTDETD